MTCKLILFFLICIHIIKDGSSNIGDLAVRKIEVLELNKNMRLRCNEVLSYAKLCDKAYSIMDDHCNGLNGRTEINCDFLLKKLTVNCNLSERNIKRSCTKDQGYFTSECGKQFESLNSICQVLTKIISSNCINNYKSLHHLCSRKYLSIDAKCNKIYQEVDDLCETDILYNFWNRSHASVELDTDRIERNVDEIKKFISVDLSPENIDKNSVKSFSDDELKFERKILSQNMRETLDEIQLKILGIETPESEHDLLDSEKENKKQDQSASRNVKRKAADNSGIYVTIDK